MSSIVIAGDTSGSVTLQAPAVAGSTVLNLPATSGTIQTSGAGYTTNGVAYASSTSVLTTGSALTFDGTTLSTKSLIVADGANGTAQFGSTSTYSIVGGVDNGGFRFNLPSGLDYQFRFAGSDAMRLTSTGLGIGTGSPSQKLDVATGYANLNGVRVGADGNADIYRNASLFIATSDTLVLKTGGSLSERARIDPTGNWLVGSTSSTGSASNTAITISGLFQTTSGSVSAPSSTATTVATLPNVNYGTWIVCIALSTGVAATWSSTYVLNTQGTSSNIGTLLAGSGSGLGISMSGTTLRVQQGSGATQTIYWSITRIF